MRCPLNHTGAPTNHLPPRWRLSTAACVFISGSTNAFGAFRNLNKRERVLLHGSVLSLPPADSQSTLDKHADHLGLHLRNTKYIAPEVKQRTLCYLACVPSNRWQAVLSACRIPLPFQTTVYGMQEQREFDAASLGEWAQAGKEKWLWSLTIKSPGAMSQMILFRHAL